GGGHAVSGDVGNQEASAMLIHCQEFVEVPSHRSHRQIGRGDAEIAKLRYARRQDRELQLAGYSEFVLNRQQAALPGENDLEGNVSERKEENGEAERIPDAA